MKPFTTLAEVKEYTSGETIICLECGKSFKMIYTHLKVHGMTQDEYRLKYNIPNGIALTGSGVLRKMSTSNKTSHDVLRARSKKAVRISSETPKKQHPLYLQEFAIMGKAAAAAAKRKFNHDDIENIEKAHTIYIDESMRAACKFLGIKPTTFYKWIDRLGLSRKF
jgi:hypothetical protein